MKSFSCLIDLPHFEPTASLCLSAVALDTGHSLDGDFTLEHADVRRVLLGISLDVLKLGRLIPKSRAVLRPRHVMKMPLTLISMQFWLISPRTGGIFCTVTSSWGYSVYR